jgi:glycosyltransferase involved in cell wall biosynthesis
MERMELLELNRPHSARTAGQRPFISVAIPTFRRPDMVRRAVDSVLQQDFSSWEVVISDDEGPEGASWGILSEYARKDPRIRVVVNRRGQGQVENTNNAMLACAGDWIKLLHDDDWLAPEALETFARVAGTHSTAAFVTCASNMVVEDRIHFRRGGQIEVYPTQKCLTDLYLVGATRVLGIIPSTLLINSNVIQAGCLMRTYKSIALGVDQLFFVDLAGHGDMVAIDDGLIFYDFTNHPSVSASGSFQQIDQETLDLKRLTWSLIEDNKGLPSPETVVRALRVARLRGRFHYQSWGATIRDAMQILRPSVIKAAKQAILVRVLAAGPKSGRREWLRRASS